jgi:hypothetical protein
MKAFLSWLEVFIEVLLVNFYIFYPVQPRGMIDRSSIRHI